MKKTKKYIRYLKDDFTGGLSLIISLIRRDCYPIFFEPYKWYLRFKGCKVHKGIRLFGLPQVVRFPNSTIEIGSNCRFVSNSYGNYRGVNHKCILHTGAEHASLRIGDNCGFSGCSIVCNSKVLIGNNVTVGANSIIGDRDDHSELYASVSKPVEIGDNVWIGMHCIILKGVKIGNDSIVAAGSVVTKSIPDGEIWGGNPAHYIKQRN